MSYIKADTPKEQEYFDFLEELRRSGDTNMFASSPYLSAAFGLDRRKSVEVVSKWMKLHNDDSRIVRSPTSKTKRRVKIKSVATVECEER